MVSLNYFEMREEEQEQTNDSKDIFVEFAKHVLKELGVPFDVVTDINWKEMRSTFIQTEASSKPGLMYINWIVANYYGQDAYDVRKRVKGKQRTHIFPRQIACYIARVTFEYPYQDIANFYYYKTHAVVVNSKKKIEGYIETDKQLKRTIEDIIYKIKGYEYREKPTWIRTK